jgi:hypothetical protein
MKKQNKLMEVWNANVSVGDTVEYRSSPRAEPELFTTRTTSSVLSGHTAVVLLLMLAVVLISDAMELRFSGGESSSTPA